MLTYPCPGTQEALAEVIKSCSQAFMRGIGSKPDPVREKSQSPIFFLETL